MKILTKAAALLSVFAILSIETAFAACDTVKKACKLSDLKKLSKIENTKQTVLPAKKQLKDIKIAPEIIGSKDLFIKSWLESLE